MAKQITSLYIDDTSLRLLVTRGDRPKVWGNAALKPGLIDGMVVNDPGKVADAVTGLLKEQKVNPGKMIVGISAEQVLIRQVVLPLLPKSILPEAVIREARRLLPLPPEELYLSWQVINTDEDKYYIFLMAFRRNSVDSILKALKIAKIKTVALTIKPLALAHLVKDEAAVIIDTQQADFDIIVQMNGTPHLIRTLPFSDSSLTWKEKSAIIIDEVDRTLQFYASNNPDKPLPGGLPMFVSGDLAGQSELCQELNSRFGYAITLLTPPVTPVTDFNPLMYMANIALNNQPPLNAWNLGLPITKINLLPEVYRIKPIKWKRVLAVPAAVVVIMVLVPLILISKSASANISSISSQLQTVNKTLAEKTAAQAKLKKDIKSLQDELTRTNGVRDDCNSLLQTLDQASGTADGDLNTIISNLPAQLSLTSISVTGTGETVSGLGDDQETILSYARSLDNSGRFTEVIVDNIKVNTATNSAAAQQDSTQVAPAQQAPSDQQAPPDQQTPPDQQAPADQQALPGQLPSNQPQTTQPPPVTAQLSFNLILNR